MTDSIDAPTLPRRRLRLSIRGLLLLIAFVAVVMCLTQFWLANRNADRAALSYQMSVLADPGASVESRLGAVDGMSQAKGRQARRALRLLSASLHDPDPRIRASAARVLGRLGSQVIVDGGTSGIDTVRPSAEALLDLIGDPDPGVSSATIQALQFLNSADADQRPVPDELIAEKLRALLEGGPSADPQGGDARLSAVRALATLEPIGADGPSWWRLALDDPDPKVRRAAIEVAMWDRQPSQPRRPGRGARLAVPGAGRPGPGPADDRHLELLVLAPQPEVGATGAGVVESRRGGPVLAPGDGVKRGGRTPEPDRSSGRE